MQEKKLYAQARAHAHAREGFCDFGQETGMSQRINENLSRHNNAANDYVRRKSRQTGEYTDQFTTVPDNRTAEEVLSRLPKCCQQKEQDGH